MAWIKPVTNRTAADVAARNALGTLRASDLNRIEGNLVVLGDELGLSLDTVTTWASAGLPTVSDYERILNNASAVVAALPVPGGVPAMPTMPLNSYTQFNTLESIILAVQTQYLALQDAKIFAGEGFNAGDVIGVI